MRIRLDRREVAVLLRLVALVLVTVHLSSVLDLADAWDSYQQRQAMIRAGMAPRAASGATWRSLVLSVWPLASGVLLFAGAGPLARVVLLGRPRPGRCSCCGYDLQGLGGAPCPECGTASAPPA